MSEISRPPRAVRLLRIALWLLLLPGCVAAVNVLREGAALLAEPYETSRPEAFVLDGALRVAEGRPLYLDLETLPFVVHVYNPMTYVPAGIAAKVLGLDLPRTLFVGRAISFVSALALAALLAGLVWRRTRSVPAAALAAGGPFFFHSVLLTDFFRMRPETPALLLTFAGVAALLSERRPAIVAAACLFFAAFTFKQPFVSAPIAAFVWLLAERRRGDAIRFVAWMAGLIVAFVLGMTAWSHGHWLDSAVRSMAANEIDPLRSLRQHSGPLATWIGSLLLAAPVALAVLLRERRYRFLGWYAAVCLVWTAWSAGKFGAWVNYYAELGVLLLLIAALGSGSRVGRGIPALAIVAVIAVQVFGSTVIRGRVSGFFGDVIVQDLAASERHFAGLPGPRLVTNERLAVHLGDPEVLDWVLLEHLSTRGAFDVSQLFGRIAEGYYAWIIVDPHVTTDLEIEVLKAVRAGPYERALRDEPWNTMAVFRRRAADAPIG